MPLVLILRALMQVEGIWVTMPITDMLTAVMALLSFSGILAG